MKSTTPRSAGRDRPVTSSDGSGFSTGVGIFFFLLVHVLDTALVREGRGCGPDRAYVMLDLTHLEPAHIDAKLPDITRFARTYLGVEPYTEQIPVFPTAHYAMGGIPTNILGEALANNDDVIPGLYAAGGSRWSSGDSGAGG